MTPLLLHWVEVETVK